MRFLVLIGTLAMLSCISESKLVEDKLYRCIVNSLSDKEREKLHREVVEFEAHLIKKGVLESSTSQGYFNFYKKMAETGTANFSNDYDFLDKISFLDRDNPEEIDGQFDCQNQILRSNQYLKSKQYELKKELQSLKKHRVTQKMIAQTMIDFLTVEDFEFAYNKLMTLMYIEEINSKSTYR